MLLVISSATDPVAQRVAAELTRRDVSFAVINPPNESVKPSLRCALTWQGSRIRVAGSAIALDDVACVWLWRPERDRDTENEAVARWGDATAVSYVEMEWTSVVYDALQTRPRCWLPGVPMALRRADAKLRQLQLAERLGLTAPDSLVTNDADAALAFFTRHGGDVIVKAATSTVAPLLLTRKVLNYTRTIKPRDLASIMALAHAPVMLQARVPKRVELRVTVVGERVFAAEIHSQSTRRTRVDWRQYDHAHTPMRAHALPDDVSERCRTLVRELELRYGAIDLVLTPEGDYVFLEINPNGQWTWIEDATGLPITAALCDELSRVRA